MSKKYITIGKIINTQGNKGAVRVLPLTDFPERFAGMKSVIVNSHGICKTFNIEHSYSYKNYVIVKFFEITDMNEAEDLKGSTLQVPRDELMPLPDGSFYIFDILGLSVYTMGGELLGKVSDILQTGANDVYVVSQEGKKQLLIPALRQVVKEISLEAGRIIVDLPKGLL